MYKYILGMDNGTTAHYSVVDLAGKLYVFNRVPTYAEPSWKKPVIKKYVTKSGKPATRNVKSIFTFIDIDQLKLDLKECIPDLTSTICYLERPAVNFFSGWQIQSSLSAFGAWQSVLYVLKSLAISYIIIDSKTWQNALIPEAIGKNNKEYLKTLKRGDRNNLLKEAADNFAHKLYPELELEKLGDGDSICIAEYYRRLLSSSQGV